MKYAKPHLNYNEQVELLRSRGLAIEHAPDAVRALKRIGYYRLSAYTYVFRKPGAPTAAGQRPARIDTFVDGATLEQAVELSDFDDKLRGVLLTGLQQVELGLRVQVAYQLGKTNAHGHLSVEHLDAARCAEIATDGFDGAQTRYEDWRARYEKLRSESKTEDFVKHFLLKYDGDVPIWAATEFMTFGCLTALYGLLSSRDAGVIATTLGIKNRDIVYGWLKALNVLRNHCAHNARIWNRATVYPPRVPAASLTDARLHHLATVDNNRLYFLAAITAHILICLDSGTNWPRQLATVMGKFPGSHGMTPTNMMGFPEGWKDLDLWQHVPPPAGGRAAR